MAERADILWVDELPLSQNGRIPITRVWVSESAAKELRAFVATSQPPKWFLKKLQRYAENGFANYVNADGAIRPEWDGVFRIGDRQTLFRLIGFFADQSQTEFIVLDAFTKRGTGLNITERERISRVAERAKKRLWRKRGQP